MKHVTIHESYAPLGEADIAAVERQLQVSLPADYRNFILRHNGGYPEPSRFPLHGYSMSDGGTIDWFLGVHNEESDNLLDYVEVYRDRLPPNLLPIAHDPGGNLLVLSVVGRDRGKVYFWDHEEEVAEGETPTYDNIYVVTDSFDALLSSLSELNE